MPSPSPHRNAPIGRLISVAATCCLLGLGTLAQTPAGSPQPGSSPTGPQPADGQASDLQALAARVDAAHHPRGPVAPVTGFRAALELHLRAADAERRGQVDLLVKYMRWTRSDSRVRHLIRYEVKQAGSPIERGRDENGFWHLLQGVARDLTQADEQDRLACERDTNLARQLVRFADPAAVLRELTDATPVGEEKFQIGREPAVTCLTVEGTLTSFPLLRLAGEDAPVRMKIFIGKKDMRLLALQVRPIRDGKTIESEAELIRLSQLWDCGGRLVPRQLDHLFRDADDQFRSQSSVHITALDLAPTLRVEDFARPK